MCIYIYIYITCQCTKRLHEKIEDIPTHLLHPRDVSLTLIISTWTAMLTTTIVFQKDKHATIWATPPPRLTTLTSQPETIMHFSVFSFFNILHIFLPPQALVANFSSSRVHKRVKNVCAPRMSHASRKWSSSVCTNPESNRKAAQVHPLNLSKPLSIFRRQRKKPSHALWAPNETPRAAIPRYKTTTRLASCNPASCLTNEQTVICSTKLLLYLCERVQPPPQSLVTKTTTQIA